MAACTCLAKFLFNFFLILFTLVPWLLAKVGNCVACCLPSHCRPGWKQQVMNMTQRSASIGWRLLLSCACWVRLEVDGLNELRGKTGSTGRPCVFIQNHASFLDTIVFVSSMPLRHLGHVRAWGSEHLFKLPFLGALAHGMGHLAVPFKASADSDSFEVDKELLAERMTMFEDHVRKGGHGAWFPEGSINRTDPLQLRQFRAGGFTVAVKNDVEIWCMATLGTADCWPATGLGGAPSRIGAKTFRLCESSHDLLVAQGYAVEDVDEKKMVEVTRWLANLANTRVQAAVDELAADREPGPVKYVPT